MFRNLFLSVISFVEGHKKLVYTFLSAYTLHNIFKITTPKEYSKCKEYLTNKCHQILEQIETNITPRIMTFTYNIVYGYSMGELLYNKYYQSIHQYISNMQNLVINFLHDNHIVNRNRFIVNTKIAFYNKGILEAIQHYDKYINDLSADEINLVEPLNYDLVEVTDLSQKNNSKINIMIFKTCPEKIICEPCNTEFMLITLKWNIIQNYIRLKTDNMTYYMVNNIIDNVFLRYYMMNILKVPEISDDFQYDLEIIDHEVNQLYLSSNKGIILEKDGYKIFSITGSEPALESEPDVEPVSKPVENNESIIEQKDNEYIAYEFVEEGG
jgi:hypothetical protein